MGLSDTAYHAPAPLTSSAIKTFWELEEEAQEWTDKAIQQSQQEAAIPPPSWRTQLGQRVPLACEPPLKHLGSTSVSVTATDVGSYQMMQVQARAGEDRGEVRQSSDVGGALMLVLDGHSPSGAQKKGVSEYALQHFGNLFFQKIACEEHPLQACREVLEHLQDQIQALQYEDGTTVTACYHDQLTRTLYGATLGDSPAVLYTRMPKGNIEVHRLAYRESWHDPSVQARVPSNNDWLVNEGRIQHGDSGRLAVTRALGDLIYAPAVLASPILWTYPLDPKAEHVVLIATDGLTDWLTELECGALIRNWSLHRGSLYPNYESLAALLTAKARQRALTYHGGNTEDPDSLIDDITVIAFVSKGF